MLTSSFISVHSLQVRALWVKSSWGGTLLRDTRGVVCIIEQHRAERVRLLASAGAMTSTHNRLPVWEMAFQAVLLPQAESHSQLQCNGFILSSPFSRIWVHWCEHIVDGLNHAIRYHLYFPRCRPSKSCLWSLILLIYTFPSRCNSSSIFYLPKYYLLCLSMP